MNGKEDEIKICTCWRRWRMQEEVVNAYKKQDIKREGKLIRVKNRNKEGS